MTVQQAHGCLKAISTRYYVQLASSDCLRRRASAWFAVHKAPCGAAAGQQHSCHIRVGVSVEQKLAPMTARLAGSAALGVRGSDGSMTFHCAASSSGAASDS